MIALMEGMTILTVIGPLSVTLHADAEPELGEYWSQVAQPKRNDLS